MNRKIPGFVHLYIGEEAIASGVMANLTKKDWITSTHRGHGHAIAKGAQINRMMAELFGKTTGYCKGKGGSMHIADFSVGMLGANGVVGGGFNIAVGAGMSSMIKKTDQVAVCFFGDGASNRGTFHEALNMAALWKLPVLFVNENNQWASTTPTACATSVHRLPTEPRAMTLRDTRSTATTSSRCTTRLPLLWKRHAKAKALRFSSASLIALKGILWAIRKNIGLRKKCRSTSLKTIL